jgi:hypothetical protein
MDSREKEGVPSWLVCEDILTRTKDELILEAIDLLKKEMKAGHIDIKGYVAALPEKNQELEQDLFVVNNLISRAPEIREQYREYLQKEDEGGIKDPEVIMRGEGLRKFLLSVDAIDLLMKFSRVFGMWADDVGVFSTLKDPVDIMVKTANMADERIEALSFVVNNKTFENNEALSNDEMLMLEETVKNAKKRSHGHPH